MTSQESHSLEEDSYDSASALLSPQDEGSSKTERLLDQYFPDELAEHHPIDKRFSDFMIVIIVLQTILLGMEIQLKGEDYPVLGRVYVISNFFLLAAFLTEVVLKVRAEGWTEYLWTGGDAHWDALDFVLTMGMAGQMILEYGFPHLLSREFDKFFEVSRTVRMIRVVQILRRIRELTIVLGGVTGSFGALVWIFLLLTLLIYAFGIFFTVAFGDDADIFEDQKFGTMAASMMTLTDMVMGGTWGDVINPIIEKRVFMLPFFFLFITIASFGLLNLIIGVICDATAETRKRLEFQTNRTKLRTISEQWRIKLASLRLDMQSLSSLPRSNVQEKKAQRKETILGVLQHIVDDPTNGVEFPAGAEAIDIFEMLDPEGKNTLNHKQFLTGMGKLLLGSGFQLNCMSLINQGRTRRILRNQEARRDARFDKIEDQLGNIEQQLATLLSKVK